LSKVNKTDLENAANILKRQHQDVKTDTFLKFLATLDIYNRYLDLHYTSKDATRSGFNVLNTLVLFGGLMSPTEISKKIFRSKNAICHVVSTLENRGLVKTVPANNDRRSVEVHITAKGLALTKMESIIARERFGKNAFSILSADELASFNKILEKILQHTKELINNTSQDS
jgi:DNA-binding MarR family transcriptional regulator